MCRVRPARPWHTEADDISWIRLQRAHITFQRLRLLILVSVLRLGVLLGEVIQKLAGPLPVKSVVFDDGLLFSAFATTGTLQVWGLGRLPLLVPSEALGAGPSPVPALIPLRGSRPPDTDLGTSCHPVTEEAWFLWLDVSHPSSTDAEPDLGHAAMSSKTGNIDSQDDGTGLGGKRTGTDTRWLCLDSHGMSSDTTHGFLYGTQRLSLSILDRLLVSKYEFLGLMTA